MSLLNLQEKLLALRLKKGDPDAFAEVYDTYVDALYRFIYFKVPSRQDAEDITAEVFMKAWQFASNADEDIENIRAFLYRIARNAVIDFYRKNAKRDFLPSDEALAEVADDHQASLLEAVEIKLEVESMEQLLRKLKDEYREVIILRYVEELSMAEIAAVLNKSKGSIRVILHRALKVARELADKMPSAKTDA